MRRTARALSAAVLASAALGVGAGVGAADPGVPPPPADAGEPVAPSSADDSAAVPTPSAGEAVPPPSGQAAARVSPAAAAPGDTVTVSVSCGPTGGSAPATLDATSAAFEEGTVALRKVADDGGTTSGPTYRGTARIAAAHPTSERAETNSAAPKEAAPPEDTAGTGGAAGAGDAAGTWDAARAGDAAETEDAAGTGDLAGTGDAAGVEDWAETEDPAGVADDWTVDGACPDASGGEAGDPWSATMSVPEESGAAAGKDAGAGTTKPGCQESTAPRAGTSTHGTPCTPTKPACPEPTAPRGESAAQGTPCGGASAEHGVRAGAGGTFGDSVPALVAGGVLIAGAAGAAAHRLRLHLRGEAGKR
ncbi:MULTISPECIES: hypothetical protein [unclassified Streptomyces]|uniref:hypothetical protein n=1 Tax=unclassified Streptomyces TaxID=2593676 RepID=UPI001F1A1FAB|nr:MULTISPECIES: hypothetical protein [unclassified Streptomyces]WKX17608.1 hypothetical protein Q3Y68_06055 [Streptomyces sp. HUAS CX7]